MPEAQAGAPDAQQQNQQQEQQGETRSFTKAEWDAREKEYADKADKIRKNAVRDYEARLYREGRGQQQSPAKQEPEKTAAPVAPKREDFSSYEEFVEAKAEFRAERRVEEHLTKRDKEATEKQQAEERTKANSEFRKHLDAVVEELDGFGELLDAATDENVQISDSMAEAMRAAGQVGARMLHHLLSHRDELERIVALKSPVAQVREMAKLESKLEASLEKKDQPKDGEDEDPNAQRGGEKDDPNRSNDGRFTADKGTEKGTRKAPDPIEPGSGRSVNQDRGPNDKDSDSGWWAKRLAQEKADRERSRRK